MELKRNNFPQDENNRIQNLYYDVNIYTIFNRTKLQNIKNKFWKYLHYLENYEQNNIQPKLIELQQIRDAVYIQLQQAKKIAYIHNPVHESHKKIDLLIPIFDDADDNYEVMKYEEYSYNFSIDDIINKIQDIKTHQANIKHYKECSHCEKMDMVTICGCKSKHKLCSECIYDKTECPICNEDLGLVHCDICMEYKKELVDTGCKNKHQTCKDCLDKIQKNKIRRGLDNNIRNGYHRDSEPYYFKYNCPFCRAAVNIECGRDEYYHNYDDSDYGNFDYESDEEFWRRGAENDNIIRSDGITMYMEDLRETYPSRRYTRRESMRERREREIDEEMREREMRENMIEYRRERREIEIEREIDEEMRENMIEDRIESMRERATENRMRNPMQ